MDADRHIEFDRPSRDELTIALSGRWLLADGLASTESVLPQLEGTPVRQVGFDTRGLGAWDTGLLAFVRSLLDETEQRGIHADRAGLPEGLVRLLDLASAVAVAKTGTHEGDAGWLSRVGGATLRVRGGALDGLGFVGETFLSVSRLLVGRARFRATDLVLLVYQCGAQALGIVTLVSFLVGLILAFVGAVQLQQFGAQIFVADLVALGMSREMGAMMTAIIMAGRTGAAFAAQLGSMRVNEEIDALETLGLSPVDFLVLPRIVALLCMMPLLCLYADLLGILGGAVVGVGMLDLGATSYYDETRSALDLADFGAGLIKAAVYGTVVAISGCWRGLGCGRSAQAVGEATTSAVVTAIVGIVIASGILNVLDHVLG